MSFAESPGPRPTLADVARAAGPTGSVALVVCEEVPRLFADPCFARVAAGAGKALTGVGLQLVLLTVPATADYQGPVVRFLDGGHVDGALVIGMHGRRPLDLGRLGIPVVFGGRPVRGREPGRFSYVDVDNRGGSRRAAQRFLDAGRHTVATIAGPQDMTAGVDRLLGYRQAVSGAGHGDRGWWCSGTSARRPASTPPPACWTAGRTSTPSSPPRT
ncbi:substrate-binding domain-containing protein [Amycolatopsis sp. NBC_01286]|uniref:substrate-binding domain-containing protein n=1 Tax=Amycolatopsis sp. NBC_01286 TaxID=2903560 RepID=UPI002E147A98